MVTDNPQNVTAVQEWHPVLYRAHAPRGGVQLRGGLFESAMQNNIRYLLDSFTVDELLRGFRERAGKPVPDSTPPPVPFWEKTLVGTNAGRFLMGAGNTLHWMEHAELRARMDTVVHGISECRQPNGYIMAYPEDALFVLECGSDARSWVTHGLIEAGYAGSVQAFELLRGYYDWFNQSAYLPHMLRGGIEGGEGGIGMVANTRMYFTPLGQPADIQVVQRYFQENYWLDDLAARRLDALWQYPYDRPHCYLLTHLEAYLDMYRATGAGRYLEAVQGGWELYHDNWENIGGSISIIERNKNVPKSNPLYDRLGENCGTALWMLLNQRLHLLNPDNEKYVTEIEKSIYNVLLANQGGSAGFRYHTMLVGQKETPTCMNTCCEGQGTRLIGNLPEYIYSIAEDGLYVNLFEPSTIIWERADQTLTLEMQTAFPKGAEVRLIVQSSIPVEAKIRIRAPSWASAFLRVDVNGAPAAIGVPGSYVTLDRLWSTDDVISFVLPISLKLTKYSGVDQIHGRQRFALEYGPILMAAIGAADAELTLYGAESPMDLVGTFKPIKDRPLHFVAPSIFWAGTEFIPYFEVGTESFSCFPIIEAKTQPL